MYRNWTGEAYEINGLVTKARAAVLAEDQKNYTESMQKLVEAEAKYFCLAQEFKRSAVHAVHCAVKRQAQILNLHTLLGDEGEKFMVGGIFIRQARDWLFDGE